MNAINRPLFFGLVTLLLPACSTSMQVDVTLFGGESVGDTAEDTDTAEAIEASPVDLDSSSEDTASSLPDDESADESSASPPEITVPSIDTEGLDLRAVVETDRRALAGFSMENVMAAIIHNTEVDRTRFDSFSQSLGLPNAEHFIHDQFMDTYATNAEGAFDGQHCDDEMIDGSASLNGYPIECSRLEADQQGNIDAWFAVSLFNRLDIAPLDGSHCGEQRLVMANNTRIGGGRLFLIFEAQIPNPHPEQGLEGCAPIASFWAEQSLIDDPQQRGEKLQNAFLLGKNPELKRGGFGGFVSAHHFSDGTGQIRSNNFNSFTWSLREHKLSISENVIASRTVPVSNNVFGGFWADNGDRDNSDHCRAEILAAVEGLSSDDPKDWSFAPDSECWAAESEISLQNDYVSQLAMSDGALSADIETHLPSSLTAFDIAARAQFVGNCMGCHQSSNGADLGNGKSAPQSLGFVHASEHLTSCEDGSHNCFLLSPALTDDFLPHRLETMRSFLQAVQEGTTLKHKSGHGTSKTTLGGTPVNRAH